MLKKKSGYVVAVVGATGAVGTEMIEVLAERKFPVTRLVPLASTRSAGGMVTFEGNEVPIEVLTKDSFAGVDIALFSAGAELSREFAPIAVKAGAVVIDNSAAWRMAPEVPLSVSGTGKDAMDELMEECQDLLSFKPASPKVYPYQIAFNCLPHIDDFLPSGYTKEEMKMVHETRKIMGDQSIHVTATTVRVPVYVGHSEAINIETERKLSANDARAILSTAPGVLLYDDPAHKIYPMPLEVAGKDEVYVGRVREDESIANGLNLWVVADNLRKGAALNAVQIAEHLAKG
ncbi:MAG: aspartate-semialdehyde dehydrogenase [Nitrospirae bacterium]|nr:aspartate-semialdehyde dehydrogenase [Nitrospirota bacterium]